MNALQHHAFTRLLATRRRRRDARPDDAVSDRADGRAYVDPSRAPAANSIEALR